MSSILLLNKHSTNKDYYILTNIKTLDDIGTLTKNGKKYYTFIPFKKIILNKKTLLEIVKHIESLQLKGI